MTIHLGILIVDILFVPAQIYTTLATLLHGLAQMLLAVQA
jgi:hypothetical protein